MRVLGRSRCVLLRTAAGVHRHRRTSAPAHAGLRLLRRLEHRLLRSERLLAAGQHHQHGVDAGQRARPVGDHDDDAAARADAEDGAWSAPRRPRGRGWSSARRAPPGRDRRRARGRARCAGAGRPTAALPPSPISVSVAVRQAAGSAHGRSAALAAAITASDEAAGSKRAMFSATVPANSSMSCGR